MNILSINTRTFDVRAYAVTGGKRIRIKEARFNQCLEPEEVEAMRQNPEKFVADLSYVPPPPPAARPPIALVSDEPSVA